MVICFCEFSNTEHIFNQAKYVNKNTSLARQLFDIHELQYTHQLVTEKYKFFSESVLIKSIFLYWLAFTSISYKWQILHVYCVRIIERDIIKTQSGHFWFRWDIYLYYLMLPLNQFAHKQERVVWTEFGQLLRH